jgi:hypothetical protein
VDFIRKQKGRKALSGLEERMGAALPAELITVMGVSDALEVGPCRFADPEVVASLSARMACWPPELIPFASASAESFCLMRVHGQPSSAWPVVLAIASPPAAVPVASTFRGFLFFIGLHFTDSAYLGKNGDLAKRVMGDLGVSRTILETTVPPTKMAEEILRYDKGALIPQCVLALRQTRTQDGPGLAARSLLTLAKSASWWGAPHYLLARLYTQMSNVVNTCGCYWNAIDRANVYSGFTSRPQLGDLGIARTAEMEAVAFLRQHEAQVPEQLKSLPRWHWVTGVVDIEDFDARMDLARRYVSTEQWERALWAFKDALAVAYRDADAAGLVLAEMSMTYDTLGRPYEASVCRSSVVA